MSNPNNCETCRHKQYPDGGHCYMFRNEPQDVCMQHTGRCLTPLGKLLADACDSFIVRTQHGNGKERA